MKNEDVEKCLRELLKSEGYELNKSRTHGENGVDILARKEGETIYIEVIGYKSSGSTRARDFYEIFFRAISRLNDDATNCVIAMPKKAEIGPERLFQNLKFGSLI
ncbi:MAG: restriction endonuclease [Candidatus Methanoperedens sp.]|nr:restriction endonuclease [Candidatus Methanoperedens sp.]